MRRLALLVSVLAIFVAAAPAYANHSWGSYHWGRTGNPFLLQAGDNVSSAWESQLIGAVADWSSTAFDGQKDSFGNTAANPVRVAKTTGGIDPRKCRPQSGKIEVCSANYGRNGWLGLASIWISGSHITQATTKLNDAYFGSGSSYNTPAWRAMVTCQEVGHDFGLDHQDENFSNLNLGTCMDYTNSPTGGGSNGTADNEHPNLHDYGELTAIYTHLDSSSTGPTTAASGSGLQRVRDDLWVEDLGGGNKRFVWVLWSQHVPHGAPADS